MQVVKRDNSVEKFNIDKIINAVRKAFKSCNKEMPKDLGVYLTELFPSDTPYLNIEEIQNIIETTLMERRYFDVAKSFILYREHRSKIRDFVAKKQLFIENFKSSDNTANATIDDNSNVNTHNVAVMNTEMHKEDNAEINLSMWEQKVKELYPDFNYKMLRHDNESIAYFHDLSSQVGMPYCVAITMYPFLLNGLKDIGGLSAAPKNIDSFCGLFVNLVFAVAAQYKGAVATPGMLLCMDYFLRKEWGNDYYKNSDWIISPEFSSRKTTIKGQIHQYFQQICYSLMQPSGSRGNQACFWNISVFDKPFYDTMYGNFYFPDGTPPQWESLNWLQKDFVHWLNAERLKCILTFPVVSVCLIYQEGKFLDGDLYNFVCTEYSEGNSFFTYISDSADSLSSCCRLSSKIEKPQFSFTNGQLSEMTGSKNVITLNLNRIIQDCIMNFIYPDDLSEEEVHNAYKKSGCKTFIKTYLTTILDRIYKYQTAYNALLMDFYKANMLTVYNAGFIDMRKQYLTIGINGLNQAAEFLGMVCNKNTDYEEFCNLIFTTIKEQNQLHKTKELRFNTEFTPCESASIKLYNRDKKDGYWVPEDTNLYASYIFKPNDSEISVLDKLFLHGRSFCGDNLDGGSSAHINLDTHLSKAQYEKILKYAAEVGCKYFTFNVPNSECEDCGFITKVPIAECPKCHSKKINYYDRVIGYLTKIKNWSTGRQIEQKTRVYEHVDYIP